MLHQTGMCYDFFPCAVLRLYLHYSNTILTILFFRKFMHFTSTMWMIRQSICQGARPELSSQTPEFYRNVYKKCVDPEPDKRPSAYEPAFDICLCIFQRLRGLGTC